MSSSTLFRASGVAGILCGLVILVQRLVIDTLAPGSPVAIGPLGPVLGLLALTALYLRQRESSGVFGGVAYLVNFVGLAFIVGVDFSRRYVLVQLSDDIVRELFAGPTRLLFLACGISFLVGVIMFGVATIRAGQFPRLATLLYVVGFVPYSLSPFFPPSVVTAAQATAAVGVVWLGWALWSDQPAVRGRLLATPA